MNNVIKIVLLTGLVTFSIPSLACTSISTLPTTITTPGSYCLTQDFNVSGTAITIQVNDVVLDFNSHIITGDGTGFGVITMGIFNATIMNGHIDNFDIGAALSWPSVFGAPERLGHAIVDMEITNSISLGVFTGPGVLIKNNRIKGVGRWGIRAMGKYTNVIGNEIILSPSVAPGSTVYGIDVGSVSLVERNIVSVDSGQNFTSTGIKLSGSNVAVIRNRLAGPNIGIDFNSHTAKYAENITLGVLNPYMNTSSAISIHYND